MKKFFKIIFILVLSIAAERIIAADFVISQELPKTNDIKVGDEILVNINFLAEGLNYNAFEGEITLGENLEVIKTITGNSFVSVWLEDPADFSPSGIKFSGITPAGYNREQGILFSIVLKAVSSGAGEISLENASVYRNDGAGTGEKPAADSRRLPIRSISEGEEPYRIAVQDTTAPEEFALELVRDPNLSDGRYALIWNALDKGSGIASYDLSLGYSVFKQVESPYVLEKRLPHGKIKVIAYDHEGNTRESILIPPGTVCIPGACFGAIHGIIFVVIVIGLIIIWRKRKE